MTRPTATPVSTAAGRPGPDGGGYRRIVAGLAVTQTVGYGSLYYSFAVFLTPVAADLHASRTIVTGAFTSAVLAGAALAVPVGRWLDRRGARALMTTGSLLGTLLLAAFSQVNSVAGLYAVWAGIGAVGAMVFYEAAFATVIAWTPAARQAGALLTVTVVAGFASSIFLPLTGLLVQAYGWRTAALLLAVLHGSVTVPLHLLILRDPPRGARPGGEGRHDRRSILREPMRDRRFRLLAVAFSAQAAAVSSMTLHLIGLLVAAGHPVALAATITGSLGALSVTGRLVVTGLNRRFAPPLVVAAVFTIQAMAAIALPAVAAGTAGALTAVVCFGIGFGVATIARPALLTGLFGTDGYATRAGLLAVPVTIATALAPLATAALHQLTDSYTSVLLTIAACNLLAAAGVILSHHTGVAGKA